MPLRLVRRALRAVSAAVLFALTGLLLTAIAVEAGSDERSGHRSPDALLRQLDRSLAPAPSAVPGATPPPAPPLAADEFPPAISQADRVMAAVGYDPAPLGFTVAFVPYTGGYRGLTHPFRQHIEIFVRPGVSDAALSYATAHEIGHAVDLALNSDQDRAAWRQARGIPASTPWWPTPWANDLASPAGDFAECFASWRVDSQSHSSWGPCDAQFGLMSALAN